MEINDILKLIEAVSEHGLTSFVLEENGSKISMKKEKEVITVTAAPADGNCARGGRCPGYFRHSAFRPGRLYGACSFCGGNRNVTLRVHRIR